MAKQWRAARGGLRVRDSREGESRTKLATARWFYRLLRPMSEIDDPVDAGDFRLVDRQVVDAVLADAASNIATSAACSPGSATTRSACTTCGPRAARHHEVLARDAWCASPPTASCRSPPCRCGSSYARLRRVGAGVPRRHRGRGGEDRRPLHRARLGVDRGGHVDPRRAPADGARHDGRVRRRASTTRSAGARCTSCASSSATARERATSTTTPTTTAPR